VGAQCFPLEILMYAKQSGSSLYRLTRDYVYSTHPKIMKTNPLYNFPNSEKFSQQINRPTNPKCNLFLLWRCQLESSHSFHFKMKSGRLQTLIIEHWQLTNISKWKTELYLFIYFSTDIDHTSNTNKNNKMPAKDRKAPEGTLTSTLINKI